MEDDILREVDEPVEDEPEDTAGLEHNAEEKKKKDPLDEEAESLDVLEEEELELEEDEKYDDTDPDSGY